MHQHERTTENSDKLIVLMSARILVPAGRWKFENRSAKIKNLVRQLSDGGCLTEFKIDFAGVANALRGMDACPACHWNHDAGFTQIRTDGGGMISLSGILPDIVRLVHQAHEKGFAALSTKDDELLKICGGYRHPCKAFDDLNRRGEYKLLFDTCRRGFISLRGAVGRNRNKSESNPECTSSMPCVT